MKRYSIDSWIALHRLSSGRRAWALKQLKLRAAGQGIAELDALVDAALGSERALTTKTREWKATQGATVVWPQELVLLDAVLDRSVTGLRDALATLALLPNERGEAAKRLLTHFAAEGVLFYTQAVYEEEAERVGELLAALDGAAADVSAATVGDFVDVVRTAHQRYQQLVDAPHELQKTDWATVKELDLANHRQLLDIVLVVLAATRPHANADAIREKLLAPIAEQDADVAATLRAKRKLKDVDPESGEPVENEAPLPEK